MERTQLRGHVLRHNRLYAQKAVFGLGFGLVQRDRKLPRRCDDLETENVFETAK